MSKITFNIAARCEAAGRAANQDNMWLCADLTQIADTITPAVVNKDGEVVLGKAGALLVVADGMGGMNAGEVASELVIKGIRKAFSRIPADILNDPQSVQKFIGQAIKDADSDVKQYASTHPEASGLGSTIVLLWLLGTKAYCGWVGDSRIYCYNPNNSLVRLSHDHSYVQRLVDEGKIAEEDAFDHPDGNIITRSIGDSGDPVQPEVRVYDIHERDVFLLCSDGLCGLLPDGEIEEIISVNCQSSKDSLDALWSAGAKAGFTDNCTIQLACIDEAPLRARGIAQGYPKAAGAAKAASAASGVSKSHADDNDEIKPVKAKKESGKLWILGCVLALAIIGAGLWFLLWSPQQREAKRGQGDSKEYVVDKDAFGPSDQGADAGEADNQQLNEDQQSTAPSDKAIVEKKAAEKNTKDTVKKTEDKKESASKAETAPKSGNEPSKGFLSLLSNLEHDYSSAQRIWQQAKSSGRIDARHKSVIDNFCANANRLVSESKQYSLTDDQKAKVSNISTLAASIKRGLYGLKKQAPQPKVDDAVEI